MTRTAPMTPLIVLSLLAAGQTAVVESVMGGTDETHRLREMGLCDGATIEMLRPGSPCLVRLGGQKLGLRSDALHNVLVRPEFGA